MPEYIEREADGFKYYVVRDKNTGLYFRGKGENKWDKYYNQASVYRVRKHAENAVVDLARRGAQAEVVEIRITNAADVAEVRHGEWEECDWVEFDGHSECVHYPKQALCCSECRHAFKKELLYADNYCPNCGAKMDGKGECDG